MRVLLNRKQKMFNSRYGHLLLNVTTMNPLHLKRKTIANLLSTPATDKPSRKR